MEKSILLQQHIRNNAEDLEKEFLQLKNWEEEMKRKDAQLCSSGEQTLPPIRSKKVIKTAKKPVENKTKPARIKSYDYSAWEQFDVDKACEEVDEEEVVQFQKVETEEKMSEKDLEQLHCDANEFKGQGNYHVKNREWKKAINCYSEAIKICNFDATYYANRALCYLKLDDFYATEADCTIAIQLDGLYVKAYHRRATARMKLKQYKEAKDDLERLLKIEPSNAEATLMMDQLNKIMESQKVEVAPDFTKNDTKTIEEKKKEEKKPPKKTSEKNVNESTKVPEESRKTDEKLPVKPKSKVAAFNNIKEKETKSMKNQGLPSWVPDLGDNYEVVEPVRKPSHRHQKPMRKVPIMEANFGASALSKSIEQLEAESKKQKAETRESKCVVDSKVPVGKDKKNDKVLIEEINEEVEVDMEMPTVPKTAVEFLSNWNKTKSSTFRYKYLQQIKPECLPTLFKDFLEFETLNEIIEVLNKEFVKRKQPVYEYLEHLSNVKRFRAIILFLDTKDKKVLKQLLEYIKAAENKSADEIAKLRDRYEI